jgi:hypothetical protein
MMENQEIFSRILGMQNTTVANTMAIICTMQQHGEDLLKTTLTQSSWLPRNSKDACLYWVDCYSKYLQNMKSVVDQGVAAIELLSSSDTKPGEVESQQAITTERVTVLRPTKKSPGIRKKSVSAKKTVVTPGKLEEKKSKEAKVTAFIPQSSVSRQLTAPPALEDKESAVSSAKNFPVIGV